MRTICLIIALLWAFPACDDAAGTRIEPDTSVEDTADVEPTTDTLAADTETEDAEPEVLETDAPEDAVPEVDAWVPREAPCERSSTWIECAHESPTLEYEDGSRQIHIGYPAGSPPESGWPVAIFFQGSFMTAGLSWSASPVSLYGLYYRVEAAADLLDAGFVVIAPDTQLVGYWDTNIQPWASSWDGASDDDMMLALLAAIDDGTLGPLDSDALFASGISSGGYMTSRMALSYPGRFRALAIASASWATCGGVFCAVPDELPEDHPPTLFLHGGSDTIVPSWTMDPYHEGLQDDGVPTEAHVELFLAHAWHPESAELITNWFERFLP